MDKGRLRATLLLPSFARGYAIATGKDVEFDLPPSLSRPTRIRRQVAYRVVRAPHSKRHASFEIAGQCHRERFGALKHHLASCSYGRQRFPLRVALRSRYHVDREIPSASR